MKLYIKRTVSLFFILVFVLCSASCGKAENQHTKNDFSDSFLYSYRLDNKEKIIYSYLKKSININSSSAEINGLKYDSYKTSFKRAVQAFVFDNPEYFWLTGGYSLSSSDIILGGSSEIVIDLDCYAFWKNAPDKNSLRYMVDSSVNAVVEQAKQYGSYFEKALFVHDYLIGSTEYDDSYLETIQNENKDGCSESAFGALINKKAVCSGYSKAYCLVLSKLGIPCKYVIGTANGQPHALNQIAIDNESYFVDCTFDDAQYTEGNSSVTADEPSYDYFGITSSELGKTHTVDSTFDLDESSSDKYNYYSYFGLVVSDFDMNLIFEIVKKQEDKNIVAVKFLNRSSYNKGITELIHNNRWYELFSDNSTVSYTKNDDKFILKFIKTCAGWE